jgi:hypothetical protein
MHRNVLDRVGLGRLLDVPARVVGLRHQDLAERRHGRIVVPPAQGLTEAEVQEAATLLRQYERVMLVRAHAAALLKQRGHDVSSLLTAA